MNILSSSHHTTSINPACPLAEGTHHYHHHQAKEGAVQPADIQLRIDRPEAETTVEVKNYDDVVVLAVVVVFPIQLISYTAGRRRRTRNIFQQARLPLLLHLRLRWPRQRLALSISLLQEWGRFAFSSYMD